MDPRPLERIYDALGETSRRQILRAVEDGPLTVGEIAAGLPITRPAVSRHIRVLREAGLIATTFKGNKTYVHLRPDGIKQARDELDRLWGSAMARFKLVADNLVDEP